MIGVFFCCLECGRCENFKEGPETGAGSNQDGRRKTNETEEVCIHLWKSCVAGAERDGHNLFLQWDMEENSKGKACG